MISSLYAVTLRCLSAALFLTLVLTLAPSASAVQQGRYSMEILVDGVPLQEHVARATNYIEALEGREYSIRLRNHTGERIAVALSVDGLNSIDAKTTTARKARKWILGPYRTITLDGWQTSSSTARRFFFTTEENSYGAWLGKTSNLGIISAAVFRENKPRPVISCRPDKDAAGQPAPAESKLRQRKSAGAEAEGEAREELSDDLAATGIGREVDHRVRQVRFEAEASPSAVLQVRYEYHDALVALGVLPRSYQHRDDPLSRRERARGFEETGFAPDPFRR
jgi:hypothetical protein